MPNGIEGGGCSDVIGNCPVIGIVETCISGRCFPSSLPWTLTDPWVSVDMGSTGVDSTSVVDRTKLVVFLEG